jgi:signal transduction histidine kinase/ActR/RegA family two-component response regulator
VTSRPSAEERFLVLAPTGRDAPLTCLLLEREGMVAASCGSLAELCQRFESEGAMALLIAEEVFAGGGVGLFSAVLARQSTWSDVPVLIFTGKSELGTRHVKHQQLLSGIGNVLLLERPLLPVSVLSAAHSAQRARRRQYEARAELFAQQRAVRERDQFLAMLGHELRNPLAAISMALDLDARGGALPKSREIMLRQTKHLTRLVDDLLDVSRVTSGKISLRRERVELVALTRRCIQQLAPSLKPGMRLELVEPDGRIFIDADGVRMEQVINNLLHNALKYTGAGGEIRVLLGIEEDQAVLRVRDTGVGLAPEMIERIFELFTQVESSLDRAQGGLGIGLTLVRNLVELHGGTVRAWSAGIGRGCEFSVHMPRAKSTGQADEPPAPVSAPRTVGTRTVLIVEDNEDSRELLESILTQRGYRVFSAEDGPSGIEQALARRPSVLLVDIGLPGADGYTVARELRTRLDADTYMVALTGYGQPEDRARAVAAGFDAHMTKPVDIRALEQLISGSAAPRSAATH